MILQGALSDAGFKIGTPVATPEQGRFYQLQSNEHLIILTIIPRNGISLLAQTRIGKKHEYNKLTLHWKRYN